MNQKEYNLIAYVIRDRKQNSVNSLQYGYSQDEVNSELATIADLQDHMAMELAREYSTFDKEKFTEACRI